MTTEDFQSKGFEELMEQLYEENDNITTLEILKGFIKAKIDNDDFNIASHLCNAIWNDPDSSTSEWYDYDYSMGTLDTPVCLSRKEDIEYLIYD